MRSLKILIFSFIFSSLASAASATVPSLAPEILTLKTDATLPAALFKKYSTKALATALVQRYHRKFENQSATTTTTNDFDFLHGTVIQMQFPGKYAASILKNGFLNQHQTGTSGGALLQKFRRLLEDTLIGVRIGASSPMANELRPKYAFLNFLVGTPNQHIAHLNAMYGDVVAVFSDRIKKRTTFSVDDTLDSNQAPGEGFTEGEMPIAVEVQAPLHTFAYQSVEPLLRLKEPVEPYWEAQIWGALTVEDVEYFLVNCPNADKVFPDRVDAVPVLKQSGRPIFKCEWAADKSHFAAGAEIH